LDFYYIFEGIADALIEVNYLFIFLCWFRLFRYNHGNFFGYFKKGFPLEFLSELMSYCLLIGHLEFLRVSHIEHYCVFIIQVFLGHRVSELLLLLKKALFHELSMGLGVG